MADPARNYTRATRSALVALSQGTCYEPDCIRPLIEFDEEGEPYTNFDIAHIRDARPGNRYVEEMTDEERANFKNLVLLCRIHHTKVDKTHPERYSIETLEQWKRDAADGDLAEVDIAESEDMLGDLLRSAASAIKESTTGNQLGDLFREVERFISLANGWVDKVNSVWEELEGARAALKPLRAVQDGKPIVLQPELPPSTISAYQSRAEAAVHSGMDELNGARPATREAAAAVAGASGEDLYDYTDWLGRAQEELVRAFGAWDQSGYRAAVDGLVLSRDAFAQVARGEGRPPIPPPAAEPQKPEPTVSDHATSEIEDLAERAQAARSHPEVAKQVLADLLQAGDAASNARKIGPIGSDPFETCGFWVAHFLKMLPDIDLESSLEQIGGLQHFEFRLHAGKQLYHAFDGDSDAQATIAAAGLEMIETEAASTESGLVAHGYVGDAVRVAIWTWEWWGGAPSGPREDLLRSLEAEGPCLILRTFANHATINGSSQLTFYGGRQAIPDDPLPLVRDELLDAIAEHHEDVQPAPSMPASGDGQEACLNLVSEYLLITATSG